MRLRALELDRFKKFDRAVRIGGIEDGLNLIAGPNEMGKSTLLAALAAVLFEKHGSRSKAITDLQPRGHDTAPWVALDFELEGRPHRIEKRFLKRPTARLLLPGERVIEGDAAEHELRRLLGLFPAGGRGQADIGLWRLLLVGQGQSVAAPEVDAAARRTLQQALEAELGSLTGSESAKALIRRLDAELHELIDRRGGRPKGRYREVVQALDAAGQEIARLERERDALAHDLDELETTRAQLEELAGTDPAGDETEALARLEARRDAMVRARQAAAQAEAALERARREFADAEAGQDARHTLAARHEAAARDRERARLVLSEAQEALEARKTEGDACKAERERLAAEHAEAAAQVPKLDALASLARERERVAAALADASPEVGLALAPKARTRVRVDGRPLTTDEETRVVVAPIEIAIEGIGRIAVRPPAGLVRLHAEQERLEGRIRDLLRELGLGQANGTGRLPEPALIEDALARARGLLGRLGEQLAAAGTRLEDAREAWREARSAAQTAQAALDQADAQLADLARELARAREQTGDDDLAARLEQCRSTLAAAERRVAASDDIDGDALAALEQEIVEHRQAGEARRAARHELEKRLERLGAQIEAKQGTGLSERIEEQRRIETGLERGRQALAREVAVLTLLRTTLEDAEREAKERYLGPLLGRLRPHLETLWPGAAVAMDEDFRITEVHRAAGREPFDGLSEGTREQIAVLARIACAELLAEQGLPAVLVLDDALVFSDDERLERMFEILERAAHKLQIIVLTCRERVFSDLGATRLRIEEAQLAS